MKRFLLLFCTVVLVCSIMVVPVLGSELLRFEFTEDDTNFFTFGEPLHGEYLVSFLDSNYSSVISIGPSDFTYPNEVMESFDYMGVAFDFSFSYVDSLNLQFNCVGCSDIKCGSLKSLFPDISYIEFIPAGTDQPVTGGSPLSGIFDVFGGVGSWIVGQLGTTTSLFWNGQGLTFLGVLSVCALALAVVLLLVFVIVRFLRFRG